MKTPLPASTILIVDDTPANIGPLALHLEECGFRVVVAQDGLEGLSRAEFVRPDLILLDVMMPGLDGFETCRRLKANEATREIPVMFMTALDEIQDKIAGFEAGAVDYVTKPLQIAEVLARVATHLSLREAQASLARAKVELEEQVSKRTADLRTSEARLRRLVEANIIGISFWTRSGDVVDANDAFLSMVGYTRADLANGLLRWSEITPREWRAADEAADSELLRTGTCTPYEKEYQRKDGSRVPILVGGALFEGSLDRGVAFVLDLTQRKRAEAQIRHMAHHDPLTDLPNRELLEDRLSQDIAQARREAKHVALLVVGLDHFKHVNDSLGHETGDALLRTAGKRLLRCVAEGDTVARLGGDQFAVVLPNAEGGDGAAAVAAKVIETFNHPFEVEGHSLRATASVGISQFPADGDDAAALVSAAESAMYSAKEQGRAHFQYFARSQNEASRARVDIASALYEAQGRGELLLHYQPQIDLGSGRQTSAEALLRWRRGGKLVSCAEFIGIAEDTGLIVPLGEWALREACRELKTWHEAGRQDLQIAVNVSPRQLRRPGFADLVLGVLRQTGLEATALELEITESLLMQGTGANIEILERLGVAGVRISIDDFGVGYSNLGYLQRFPMHSLKIDRSFVSNVVSDPSDRAIVLAIIAMAKSLGVKVVAEGVETEAQAEFLRTHGCDAAQGYLYGRPSPPEDFLAALRRSAAAAPLPLSP